jgi:hypothetical protein
MRQQLSRVASRTRPPAQEAPAAEPARPGPDEPLLQLQRTRGNQYVQRLVGRARTGEPVPRVQRAVRVGAPDSVHEREADRVADQIMRKPEPGAAGGDGPRSAATRSAGPANLLGGGSGQSLPGSLRSRFEGAFGVDLSGVRVHTGPHADRMNRGLGSTAFTHGSDVFFGGGRYAPDTRAGQHLLAHELTHVVQQGGTPGLVQRRLAFEHTNWQQARGLKSSGGEGGTGVIFVHDAPITDLAVDQPLVVKSRDTPVSVALSGELHDWVGDRDLGDRSPGRWTAKSPEARPISPAEAHELHAAVQPLIEPDDWKAAEVVAGVLTSDSMVYKFAAGRKFAGFVEESHGGPAKHTRRTPLGRITRRPGDRKLRSDSGFGLFADHEFVKALGRTTAVDILTGNSDRINGLYNPLNFMVDIANRQISLIDNVYGGRGWDVIGGSRRTPNGGQLTSEESYGQWAGANNEWSAWMRNQRFDQITDKAWQTLYAGVDVREQDFPAVRRVLEAAKPAFTAGLRQGWQQLTTELPLQQGNVLTRAFRRFQGANPRDAVERSLNDRVNFISGGR